MRQFGILGRLVSFIAGSLLVVGFCELEKSSVGADIAFLERWTASSPGEINTWLAFVLLLTPGSVLVAWSLAPQLAAFVSSINHWLNSRTKAQRTILAVSISGTALVVYGSLQAWVSRGFPLLDEIASARFGGRALAQGRIRLELPDCWQALPRLYLHARDGFVTSFDWLGVQLAWAFSELTHTGGWIFAILSAVTLTALMVIVSKGLGFAWGILAALAFALSPMALTLSVSNHAHIGSRCALALTLMTLLYAQGTASRRRWIAVGLSFGLGIMFRPIEVTTLLLPLLISVGAGTTKEAHPGLAYLWILVGCLPSLALIAFHNSEVTGHPWLFARFAHNDLLDASNLKSQPPWAVLTNADLLWKRFGTNLIYNLQQLILWVLGPLGAVCFACGVTTNRLTRLLATGLALELLLALAHDDSGLHVFGPLHYSDAAVPALIVIVYGLERAYRFLKARLSTQGRDVVIAVCVGMLCAAIGLTQRQLHALRQQGVIHEAIYSTVWDKKFNHSVVLAPRYEALWKGQLPTLADIDSHLRHWQPSHPRFNDRVVFAYDLPGASAELARCFPDRRLFRLYTESGALQTEELSEPDDVH